MTPRFAKAVDPVFAYVLDLFDRIDRGQKVNALEEKARIAAQLQTAGTMLSESDEWSRYAKYALIAWIDSELATVREWEGRDWWLSNSLEIDYHGQGLANHDFYARANEAGRLGSKDALEVFYICVVLGFRGFYENANTEDRMRIIESLQLPPDLKTWTKRQSQAIRLQQDRPAISDTSKQADFAPPLDGEQTLLGTAVMFAIIAAVCLPLIYILLQ
ncbi:DotU family type IV/VI secretion system protein [Anatilimnocola floriformis]|uniref:DotU family type IV/VI secretion system protein n=1 Tax=Anatilimnocola floriformis TaxID=2948575 RepID=UPI0020C36ECF|nr:DotU family type IV/VI secretion system protein [Anatilimnocola floriformis]